MKSFRSIRNGLIVCSIAAVAVLSGCSQPMSPLSTAPTMQTTPIAASERAAEFLGVWSNDHYPIVEITRRGEDFYVREFYGVTPADNRGLQYPAQLEGNQIVAIGDAKLFYKHERPTFSLLPNRKLKFDCGVGPFELNRSTQIMPQAQYAPSHWNN